MVRIDTPQEALYYANGGISQYVLRQLLATKPQPVGVYVHAPLPRRTSIRNRSVSFRLHGYVRLKYDQFLPKHSFKGPRSNR